MFHFILFSNETKNRKVQGVPQPQTAASQEEKNDKN